MDKRYDIYLNGAVAGKANIYPEGLYCRIDCACSLPDSGFYTISIKTDNDTISLGTCMPMGKSFGIRKRIPVKRISGKSISFYIRPKKSEHNKNTIEVRAGEPISFLRELEKLRLKSAVINGLCWFETVSNP